MDRKMLADSAAAAPAAPVTPTPAGVSPMPAATTQGQRQAGFAMQAFGVAPAIKKSQSDPVLGMKDGGSLRTGQGGHVPGTGTGDKIAAKYEPGEFVVSNDMLDSAPGLREQLHNLRTEVLADKGMTPEQADAKAMSGGTLRALEGGPEDTLARRFAKVQTGKGLLSAGEAAAQSASQPGVGIDAAQDARIATNARMAANARAADLAAETAGRGPGVRTGPAFAPPPPVQTAPAQPTVGTTATADPAGKPAGKWSAVKGAGSNVVSGTYGAGKSLLGTVAKAAGPATAIMQVPESYNTPTENYEARFGADASPGLRGALNAVKAFSGMYVGGGNDFTDTMAARGAGYVSDLIANTVDGATGAANWVGSKLGINPDIPSIGDKMRVNERAEVAKSAQATPNQIANIPGQDATMPGQDPGRSAADPKLVQGADGRQYLPEAVSDGDRLRSDAMIKQAFSRDTKVGGDFSMNDGINTLRTDPNAMATANKAWAMRGAGAQASYDSKGGLVLSNSTGPEKMRYTDREGNPTSQYENTAQYDNGQKQLAAASASLRNPDGTKWSANDTATMAANLRDGVDQYRGTSRAPAAAPDTSVQMSPQRARLEALGAKGMSRTQAATLQALRSSDQQLEASNNQNASAIKREQMQNDTLRDNNAATNRTALRGHELDYDAKLAPIKQAKANQELLRNLAQHPEMRGGDPALMASALTSAGRGDLAKTYSEQAAASVALAKGGDELTKNKWDDMQAQFKGQYLNPDKNGNPEANAALENRAFSRLKLTNPNGFKGNNVQRSQAIRDAIADEELMKTFGDPQDGGFASMVPEFLSSNKLDDRTNNIPSGEYLRGAKIGSKVGALRGAFSPGGLEGGDRFLELPGGRQNLNLGKLSADALARLQQHIDESNAQKRK